MCGDKTCRNPSFKEPGAACTNISTDRCAVGFSCFTPDVDGGGDAPSFCPALLALGDRCDDTDGSKTCPVFSGCYGGKCTRNWGDPVCR